MDSKRLAIFAAEMMEMLEREFPDESTSLSAVTIVVDVDEPEFSNIVTGCSDGRRWVQKAMLYEAIDQIDELIADARREADES